MGLLDKLSDAQAEAVKTIDEGLTDDVATEIKEAAKNIRANHLEKKCSKEKCSACYLNYLCLSKKEYSEISK